MKRTRRILVVAALAAAAVFATLALATPAKADLMYGTYSHDDPQVTCEVDYNSAGQAVDRTIMVDTPHMLSPRGTQQVSYQLYLYRWDPSSGSWVYDFAVNPAVGMTGPFGLPASDGFRINDFGKYYRVAVKYRWYWNGAVETSQFAWAGVHQQYFTQDTGDGISRWFGTTGDWCYMP